VAGVDLVQARRGVVDQDAALLELHDRRDATLVGNVNQSAFVEGLEDVALIVWGVDGEVGRTDCVAAVARIDV
jgi:hypothetical protein